MTASTFERALALVLKSEGGFVNNPRDPGGATNMGITKRTLEDWRGHPVTVADVKALSKNEAGKIYRRNYWDKVRGDDLPTGVDYAVFDFAVNSGFGRSIQYLQNCVKVDADGKIGPQTLAACGAMDAKELINDLCDRRLAYLKHLGTWSTFGKGWTRRIESVRKEALTIASTASTPPPALPAQPGKPPEKPVQAPLKPKVSDFAPKPEPPPQSTLDGWKAIWTGIRNLFGLK